MTIRRMPPTWKDWSTKQQRLAILCQCQHRSAILILVSWSLLQLWLFCGFPGWVKKEPVELSKISSDYLLKDHHWGIFALVLSVKLMGVQYSTPALSCCKENIFGEHYLYPEGTASMFGNDQPVDGAWTGLTRYCMLWLASQVHYYILVLARTLIGLCTWCNIWILS